MDPVYHFVKTREGGYHSGIPARDLTEEDLAGMTDEQRAAVEASPLYRRIERPAARAARSSGDMKSAGQLPAERGGGN